MIKHMMNSIWYSKDKIVVKLGLLVAIEISLVVISFGISTYIQSQSTLIGNTINIAGLNRYLTSNLLLQVEKVNDGTAQLDSLRNASTILNKNIAILRSGGDVPSPSGNIHLSPLPSSYISAWNDIVQKKIALDQHISMFLEQKQHAHGVSVGNTQQLPLSTIPAQMSDTNNIGIAASHMISSSDAFTHQLSEGDITRSQSLVSMQALFIIMAVAVGALILYLMQRLLRPISLIIKATDELKKGNLKIPPLEHCQGKDEISILTSSFNSMTEQLCMYDETQKHFISIASHELRSPLQPILGLSDILRSNLTNNKEYHELADAIFRSAKRLQNTIDNVLQAARVEKQLAHPNKERLDIYDILQMLVMDMQYQIKASNKNVQLLLDKPVCITDALSRIKETDRVFVNADRTGLVQVVTNLLNNAIKHTSEGLISVSIAKEIDDHKSTKSNQYVIVSIKDTGSGISPQMFPKLFTKFGTDSGTGLGLYVSKNIIEAHGGKMSAENNKDGMGATFTFSLPLGQEKTPGMNRGSIA